MASGSYKQPKYSVTSSVKTKPRSIDTETQNPKKGIGSVKTKVKRGYMSSEDGVVKA